MGAFFMFFEKVHLIFTLLFYRENKLVQTLFQEKMKQIFP